MQNIGCSCEVRYLRKVIGAARRDRIRNQMKYGYAIYGRKYGKAIELVGIQWRIEETGPVRFTKQEFRQIRKERYVDKLGIARRKAIAWGDEKRLAKNKKGEEP